MEWDISSLEVNMINNIRTRVILLMLAGIISSILLVSIITNITVFDKFDSYMKGEQRNKINEIIELVQKSYEVNGGWTDESLQYIQTSPVLRDFNITIKDKHDNIVLLSQMTNAMLQHHINMMYKLGHDVKGMSMADYSSSEDYNIGKYELSIRNALIGSIEIGYLGPFKITESEVQFSKSINNAIIYASIFSVIIAIILGVYFSKVITRPILKINRVANDIRKGKLNTRIEEKDKIIEFRELSSSINHLAMSLEEQQKQRQRLTTDISHELRTPLTILQSHLEAMLDGVWEPTKDRLNIFKGEIDRLIKLVEELKYLIDIENHKLVLQKEEFNLTQLLNGVIENYRYQANKQDVTLINEVSEGIFIVGDKNKINQAIINLISNALKFTSSSGYIKVKAINIDNNIIIEIEDNGIGIDKEDLPYIFDRLYRSDRSRSRKTGGTGIGLTITQKLISAHNGKIEASSVKGVGTKFTIILPIEL